ncbi:hypothetical protein RUM44_000732 [Polyplax serrata]|uniref:Uncharacterized protein n=1 Tax=Polyplax serrata TaxID=468196 RepID=A0ABR1B639_POLSC
MSADSRKKRRQENTRTRKTLATTGHPSPTAIYLLSIAGGEAPEEQEVDEERGTGGRHERRARCPVGVGAAESSKTPRKICMESRKDYVSLIPNDS